ncbi:MAG: hypothetical protein IPM11_01255 [Micropruina sp.]|nr:hypothetical protein [Micropruina sp.]
MTVSTIVSLALVALKLVSALVDYLREQKLVSAAQEAIIADLSAQIARTKEQANDAREAARRSNASVATSDRLPDDGFRRD